MADTVVPKRPREETQLLEEQVQSEEPSKRHKPYSHILSLLESEEEEPTQDLSPLITTLQQEISCSASSNSQAPLTPLLQNSQHEDFQPQNSTSSQDSIDAQEEGDKERVMRHLLEASDDELGIPNTGGDVGLFDFGDGFDNNGGDVDGFASLCDGLWELEDETANYYALLQSELFL